MRIFRKAAASAVAVGLLAFGAVAGSGGSALAGPAPGQSVTGCSALIGTLALGLQPNCTAAPSTVDNPISLTITVNTTALSALIGAIPGLAMDASWTLSCLVNGSTVSPPGSYTITSTAQVASTTIDLQAAVGSPEPNQCTISNLKVQTSVALTVGALELSPFSIGLTATALTAVPGAIYQDEGVTSKDANAVLCADDKGNANAGSKIQGFQCLSDLAEYYVWTSSGQFVHNGDCVAVAGGKVVLARCSAGAPSQQWEQSTVGGTVKNKATSTCLTASSPKDFTQLSVASCHGGANQRWHLPQMS